MRGLKRGALVLLTLCAVPALLAANAPGPNGNGPGNMATPTPTPPTPTPTPMPTPPAMTAPPQNTAPAMQAPVMQAPAVQKPPMQAPAMQAPAMQGNGAQGMGQAPTDNANAAPTDMPMNSPSPSQAAAAPARSPSGPMGLPMTGLGNGPLLNLFPGILVPFAILLLAGGLLLAFLLRKPRQLSPTAGPGRPRFQPAAAAVPGGGEMTVTHRAPTPGLSLTAVEPPEPPGPPPPPSTPTLPPLQAPGASVYLAQGHADSSDIGSSGLTAQTRRIIPPTRL